MRHGRTSATRLSTIAGLAALAVAVPVMLAGCTPQQSVKSACAQMTISVDAIGSDVTAAQTARQTSPAAGEKAFTALATKFHKATLTVTNSDVRAKANTIDTKLTAFIKAVNAQNAAPSTAHAKSVQTLSKQLTSAIDAMGKVCTG